MPAFVGPTPPPSALEAHLARQAEQEADDRRLGAGWKYGPAAASLFDAWSTQDAINRGGAEANPVMAPFADNTAALYGVKLGTGALVGLIADRLAKSGHRNAARIVSGLGIGVPLAAGATNLSGGR